MHARASVLELLIIGVPWIAGFIAGAVAPQRLRALVIGGAFVVVVFFVWLVLRPSIFENDENSDLWQLFVPFVCLILWGAWIAGAIAGTYLPQSVTWGKRAGSGLGSTSPRSRIQGGAHRRK